LNVAMNTAISIAPTWSVLETASGTGFGRDVPGASENSANSRCVAGGTAGNT